VVVVSVAFRPTPINAAVMQADLTTLGIIITITETGYDNRDAFTLEVPIGNNHAHSFALSKKCNTSPYSLHWKFD